MEQLKETEMEKADETFIRSRAEWTKRGKKHLSILQSRKK